MKRFHCEVCNNEVFFDSSLYLHCGSEIGYRYGHDDMVPLGEGVFRCANASIAGCTWAVEGPGAICASCVLTRTRPADADLEGLTLFPLAEEAKRHLLRDFRRLGITVVSKDIDEQHGLAFDLLSSVDSDVTIGHANGVITMDLAEGDDAHREQVRMRLAEPYRTMLGHFRHESGHYIEWLLLEETGRIE